MIRIQVFEREKLRHAEGNSPFLCIEYLWVFTWQCNSGKDLESWSSKKTDRRDLRADPSTFAPFVADFPLSDARKLWSLHIALDYMHFCDVSTKLKFVDKSRRSPFFCVVSQMFKLFIFFSTRDVYIAFRDTFTASLLWMHALYLYAFHNVFVCFS